MYKHIHIQRVVFFFRLKSAHFPVIRVETRHLMIIRHDVNTKRDTTMGLGADVHVERFLKNISSVLCFCGAGEKWASNIADYHVWPVVYHDVSPYCWWIWTESHHMICDIVWCYLQPELVLIVFHLSGNVYTFPPARSIWWLQFTDRPLQEQLLQSNSQTSSRFTSFSIYGLR